MDMAIHVLNLCTVRSTTLPQTCHHLQVDDAVRFGGYISSLEKLEIDFISAFPVGELSYYTTQVHHTGTWVTAISKAAEDIPQ